MACDIHLFIEVKIDGAWHTLANPSVKRNYQLFTKMAGVRMSGDEIDPISQPKGLPDDMSIVTKVGYQKWIPDAHSESWLDYNEIVKLADWIMEQDFSDVYDPRWDMFGVWLFRGSIYGFGLYREEYPAELEDVRFVFWFDN